MSRNAGAETENADVVVVGSGLGGLCAAAMLGRYGRKVLVLEAHYAAGGVAHGFTKEGYKFDTGPSFYAGMTEKGSLNPIKMVLDAVGESVPCVTYDEFQFHFPEGDVSIFDDNDRYVKSIESFSPEGAVQLRRFFTRMMKIYEPLNRMPTLALSANWRHFPALFLQNGLALAGLAPHASVLQGPLSKILDQEGVFDQFVRRIIDIECFLLSGLKADGTITAEVAFMVGERENRKLEYPEGGAVAIVDALIRGIEKFGGEVRLRTPVKRINVSRGQATGVETSSGKTINANVVISNATIWDTYGKLLAPGALPRKFRETQLTTPAVESFMHLHVGFSAEGLENLIGHHVVVFEGDDIAAPGCTCMISIPTVWDPSLAPPGKHLAHVYTLESADGWKRGKGYREMKEEKAAPLLAALKRVIPDLEDRLDINLIGSPLTHEVYTRRYKGSYGPAVAAGKASFPGPATPVSHLYRVGDSVLPGIGVPAVAASGIICANTLVEYKQVEELRRRLHL